LERKILITDIFLRKTFDVVNIIKRQHPNKDILLLTDRLSFFNRLKCKLFYNSSNLFLLRKGENFNADLNQITENFPNQKLIYLPIEEDTTLNFYNYLDSENYEQNIKSLLPEKSIFNLSRDKELLNLFCEENEIPCPKLITKSKFENKDFQLPIIVKLKKGSGSKGIVYIDNEHELSENNIRFEKNLVQERLPNPKNVEGGFYLCKNGKILSFYSHQRIRTFPECGGVTVFSKATHSEKIKHAGETIIEKLNWNGLLMIEFIFDERDGKYKLIEINPRMWGSVLLSEFCGANFLQKYIDLVSGISSVENKSVNDCCIRWIFPYDIIYFIKNLTNPFQFFNSPENTCHINFTYSSFFRSFTFILLSYFDLSKIFRLFKK